MGFPQSSVALAEDENEQSIHEQSEALVRWPAKMGAISDRELTKGARPVGHSVRMNAGRVTN